MAPAPLPPGTGPAGQATPQAPPPRAPGGAPPAETTPRTASVARGEQTHDSVSPMWSAGRAAPHNAGRRDPTNVQAPPTNMGGGRLCRMAFLWQAPDWRFLTTL